MSTESSSGSAERIAERLQSAIDAESGVYVLDRCQHYEVLVDALAEVQALTQDLATARQERDSHLTQWREQDRVLGVYYADANNDFAGAEERMGAALDEAEKALALPSSTPQGTITAGERERLHAIIQSCDALIDPEQHPELAAEIDAVLLPCDNAGHCVAPQGTEADRTKDDTRVVRP